MTAERFAASQRRTGLGRFEVTRGERRNAIKKGGCIARFWHSTEEPRVGNLGIFQYET